MTVSSPNEAAPRGDNRLPRRPPPSLFALGGVTIAVVITLVTTLDWSVGEWQIGMGFSPVDVWRNLTRDNLVVSAIPNADVLQFTSSRTRAAFMETLQFAVIATILGALVALPLALWSTKVGAPNAVVREVMRLIANVVRAIPDILWAALFGAAIGLIHISGVLALFFFTIAVIVKLTADVLDGIDHGPVEAAYASGATQTQMLRTAVVPQILPSYTSFTLYAFELNLRASAVLGLVGLGGIGSRLEFFRNRGDYEAVWGIVILFFVVVFVIEQLSAAMRRRLV